jgi:enoyl-CoA hydratase
MVLRITMDNGSMNTADDAMHAELAEIWRDVDRDSTVNGVAITSAGKVFLVCDDYVMIQQDIDDFSAPACQ